MDKKTLLIVIGIPVLFVIFAVGLMTVLLGGSRWFAPASEWDFLASEVQNEVIENVVFTKTERGTIQNFAIDYTDAEERYSVVRIGGKQYDIRPLVEYAVETVADDLGAGVDDEVQFTWQESAEGTKEIISLSLVNHATTTVADMGMPGRYQSSDEIVIRYEYDENLSEPERSLPETYDVAVTINQTYFFVIEKPGQYFNEDPANQVSPNGQYVILKAGCQEICHGYAVYRISDGENVVSFDDTLIYFTDVYWLEDGRLYAERVAGGNVSDESDPRNEPVTMVSTGSDAPFEFETVEVSDEQSLQDDSDIMEKN